MALVSPVPAEGVYTEWPRRLGTDGTDTSEGKCSLQRTLMTTYRCRALLSVPSVPNFTVRRAWK